MLPSEYQIIKIIKNSIPFDPTRKKKKRRKEGWKEGRRKGRKEGRKEGREGRKDYTSFCSIILCILVPNVVLSYCILIYST
jgi:flagellar biosynthesis/type III secretory pathway protein FliH